MSILKITFAVKINGMIENTKLKKTTPTLLKNK